MKKVVWPLKRVALILRKGFGSSLKFCDFEGREFWPLRGIFNREKAAALIPQMACRASGKDHISNGSGAQQISRGRFAPDAAGANLREVVRLMRGRRTGRMTDAYSSEVEVRRQKAGARMAK